MASPTVPDIDTSIILEGNDKVLLDSSPDRNEANRMQLDYAKRLVRRRYQWKFSIGVHKIPHTRVWGVYLEPRNS